MPENNGPLHRKPSDMQTWEIIAAYRHAYQIMSFRPNAQLARALANFMGQRARRTGEARRMGTGLREKRLSPAA